MLPVSSMGSNSGRLQHAFQFRFDAARIIRRRLPLCPRIDAPQRRLRFQHTVPLSILYDRTCKFHQVAASGYRHVPCRVDYCRVPVRLSWSTPVNYRQSESGTWF